MRGIRGTLEEPINDSKGCGGMMRVAPIGLLDDDFSDQQIIHLAAQSAALTHGHPLSTIASSFMAELIHQSVAGKHRLRQAIQNTRILIQETFRDYSEIFTFTEMLDSTLRSIDNDEEDLVNLKMIGEGWVTEETLMIAIYATLKYENDPEKAIEVSVNHSGDSDSTGALTGQIMGAFYGVRCLPQNFISRIELKDAIVEMGNRLV
jgi:ADP-ribosylglycohydrolase